MGGGPGRSGDDGSVSVTPGTVAAGRDRTRPGARDRLARVLLGVSATAILVRLVFFSGRIRLLDLRVYRDAVVAWLNGQPVYDLSYTSVHLPFTYPPFGLVALAWTGPLPFGLAAVVITVASVAAVLVLVAVVGRRRGLVGTGAVLTVALTLWCEPVRSTLSFGQVNLLLLGLVVLDAFVVPERFRGVLTGVATAVKLTPGVFLLHFLLTGQRRAAGRQVVSAVGLSLLTIAVTPGTSWRYWTQLVFANRAGSSIFVSNQALSGLVGRAIGPGAAVSPVTLGLTAVVLVAGVVSIRLCARDGDRVGAFAVTGLVGLLVSPISWSHHWVWALPAVLWLVTTTSTGGAPAPGRRRDGRRTLGTVFAVVLAIGPQILLPNGDDREYGWTWWQLLIGDLYPLLALAVVLLPLVEHRSRRRAVALSRAAGPAPRRVAG